MVDGGISWGKIGKGLLAVAGTVVAGAGMMATAPAILAASTTAFVVYGVACIAVSGTAAAVGGWTIGDGIMH